ncbi:MAG: DNA primase, partial [Okeania sp. SIO2D1]|nr:DNA primase [Okeania sp. SIO2D1]
KLQDSYLDAPDKLSEVEHLFHLDEKAKRNLLRAPLEIRSTIATIELIMCRKRRSTVLSMWQNTDLSTDSELAKNSELAKKYQEKFYSESEWIKELERLRITTIYDLIQVPLGELSD